MKRALFRSAHGSYSFSLLTVPTETGACPSWNGAVSVLSCVDNLWKIWLWALCLELQDKPCNSWQEKVPLTAQVLNVQQATFALQVFPYLFDMTFSRRRRKICSSEWWGTKYQPRCWPSPCWWSRDASWLPTAASSSCISQHCAEASSPHSGQADEFGCSTAGKPLVIHTASCAIWTHELGSPNLRDICVGW